MIDSAANTSMLSSIAPESGQLVEVRRHQWIVFGVDASAVSSGLPKCNLVKLASIDEDVTRDGISAATREQMIALLLKLNRERCEEGQVLAHAAKSRASKGRAKAPPTSQDAFALVDAPATTSSMTEAADPARKASTRRSNK